MTVYVNKFLVLGITIPLLGACQYEDLNRSETMSLSSGNAIAHNSALQIIDPWPRSAGDNYLEVPAIKYGGEPKKDAAAPTPLIIQTTSTQK